MALETPYTISSIVDEVTDVLHSYARSQEQRTSLAAPMTDTETAFTVNNVSLLTRGDVEIDDELVYVSVVNPTTGVATIEPWGRAQSGTTAVAHSAGAKVTMSPLYPRQRVGNIVASIMREIFPAVFAVDQDLLDINPARTNYALPTDAYQVLSVEWHWPGPSEMWAPVERWRQNKPTTGLEIEIISATWPGTARVRVKYAKTPKTSWDFTDDLSTYGYDTEIRDVIVLGAVARALTFTEPSRLQMTSLESAARAENVAETSNTDAARHFYALFRQRLDEERAQILLRHPIQPHRTR